MLGNRLRYALSNRSKNCGVSPAGQVTSSSSQPAITSIASGSCSGSYWLAKTAILKDEYNRELKIKNGRCGDKGFWVVDAINMGSSGWIWEWTIYTEDADGDPSESHTEHS